MLNQVFNGKIGSLPDSSPLADIGINKSGTPSFADILRKSIAGTNLLQNEADIANKNLALGQVQVEDLHQIILAGEKAEVSLLLTVQIRNKIIEAYQELMRMQV